ncbi:MAG TPA: flagellar hook-length control protein FliK [Bacillota bacterium]|nr:flagellar hook-length control protein FliK [Bacillota bacterium]
MLTSATPTLSPTGLEVTPPDAAAARQPGWEPEQAVSWFAALAALLLDVGRGYQVVPAAGTGLPALTEPASGEVPGREAITPLGEAVGLPAITGGLRPSVETPSLDLGTSAPLAFYPSPGLGPATSSQGVEPGALPPGAALQAGPSSPPGARPVAGTARSATRESPHPAPGNSREAAAGEQFLLTSALLLPSASRTLPAGEETPPQPLVPPALGGGETAPTERVGDVPVGRSSPPAPESGREDGATGAAQGRPMPPAAEPLADRAQEPARRSWAADAPQERPVPAAEPLPDRVRDPARQEGASGADQEQPRPAATESMAHYAQSAATVSSAGEDIPPEPRPTGNSLPSGPEVPAGEAWAALRARITELDPQRQSIRVAMDPEGLGAMQLEVSLTGDGARASFEVADPAAGQFLANREADLRQALEGVGVRLNSVNVRLGDSSGRQEGRTPGPDDSAPGAPAVPPPTRRLTPEAGSRSRQSLVDYRV